MTGATAHTGAAAWWVLIGFDQHGPWDVQRILSAAAQGQFGPESLVWAAGMPEWAPARTTALAAYFTPPPPPAPAPVPPPAPAPAPVPVPAPAPAPATPAEPAEPTAPAEPAARTQPVAAPSEPAPAAPPGALCPYCHTELGATGHVTCPSCQATHHDDCWAELTGCAVVGCAQAPGDTPASAPAPAAAAPSPRAAGAPDDLGFFTARASGAPSPAWAPPDPSTLARSAGAARVSPDWAPPSPESRR